MLCYTAAIMHVQYSAGSAKKFAGENFKKFSSTYSTVTDTISHLTQLIASYLLRRIACFFKSFFLLMQPNFRPAGISRHVRRYLRIGPVTSNQCCGSMTFWCGSGFGSRRQKHTVRIRRIRIRNTPSNAKYCGSTCWTRCRRPGPRWRAPPHW